MYLIWKIILLLTIFVVYAKQMTKIIFWAPSVIFVGFFEHNLSPNKSSIVKTSNMFPLILTIVICFNKYTHLLSEYFREGLFFIKRLLKAASFKSSRLFYTACSFRLPLRSRLPYRLIPVATVHDVVYEYVLARIIKKGQLTHFKLLPMGERVYLKDGTLVGRVILWERNRGMLITVLNLNCSFFYKQKLYVKSFDIKRVCFL